MQDSAEGRHIFRSKMREWRKRSPLRKWRERMGFDINTAAFYLGLSFSTYQKWDYGNGHPVLKDDGDKIRARVNVAINKPEPGKAIQRESRDWDEYMEPLTGVSITRFMRWYYKRPKP